MEFAMHIGEEKIVIYKHGQDIVLNEPAITAHDSTNDYRLVAVGACALRYIDNPDITFRSVVTKGIIENVDDDIVFLKEMIKKVGGIDECICCIPSSLSAEDLNEYKTVLYAAGIRNAEFIPSVVAAAIAKDYSVKTIEPVFSSVKDGEFVDMCVISAGSIIDGGTLEDYSKYEIAKKELKKYHHIHKVYNGGHIDVIYGA